MIEFNLSLRQHLYYVLPEKESEFARTAGEADDVLQSEKGDGNPVEDLADVAGGRLVRPHLYHGVDCRVGRVPLRPALRRIRRALELCTQWIQQNRQKIIIFSFRLTL